MSRRNLSLASLFIVAALPLAWVACGGSKPPETPADESANNADAAEPASSAAPADSSAAAPAASDDSSKAAPADTTPATPPPPAMSDSDCGKCIDKTCAKPAAACGKDTDCQGTMDAFHSCGSDKGAAACIDAAAVPPKGKGKKLATAYEGCAKKAVTKACKAQCSK
jgi:hypothetical protein